MALKRLARALLRAASALCRRRIPLSILLAFCTLLLVVAGGLVTSRDARREGGTIYEHGQSMVATTAGLLTVVSVIWLFRSERRQWLQRLGAIAPVAVIVQGVLGGLTVLLLLFWWISTSHASLAQLFFSTTVAVALFTSNWWLRGPLPLEEGPKFPIRGWSPLAPVCVLCQLALGAAARHGAIGSLYHILASPIVTGVILWVSLRILFHYAQNREVRLASTTLLGITFCQVFPGIAAHMSRVAYAAAVQSMPLTVAFTVFHVAVGALTMAAALALAILVRRNLPAPARAFADTKIGAVA